MQPGSLARQLLGAQVLVVSAMALTVVVVAAIVGPPAAERHMRMTGHGAQPDVLEHAEEAFRLGLFTSLGGGIAIALAGAVIANVWLSRRLGTTVAELRRGSERVADGDYSAPIELADGAHELRTVAKSLNSLASQVGATEATRRRMLTDLSHELRTPIATLSAVLEALEDGVAELTPETLAVLRHQCMRLHRLAVDMRDVSAFEEGRLPVVLERARLDDVLRAAVDTALPRYEAAGVSLDLPTIPSACVAVDRQRIGQVLDNLLRNALQHGATRVTLASDVSQAWVRIEVIDDGRGIKEGELPHIFERFYRGDGHRRHDEGAGTGVGLTISRAIAEAHGGRLTGASVGVGRGSTFTLQLPEVS